MAIEDAIAVIKGKLRIWRVVCIEDLLILVYLCRVSEELCRTQIIDLLQYTLLVSDGKRWQVLCLEALAWIVII